MKKQFLCVLLILLTQHLTAQLNRYIIVFRHKGGGTETIATPASYLSARALERRAKQHIAIDSSDLPVPRSFIATLHGIPNVTVLNVSRWLNSAVIRTTDPAALSAIQALPFVQSTAGIAAREEVVQGKFRESIVSAESAGRQQDIEENYFNYGSNSFAEIHLHNGEFLHNVGLRGQGMQIAMLDGGYLNYTTLKAFDSVNANGQILTTWDFVAGHSSVVEDHSHGMQCLSTIAANIPGQFIGKAPKASFHLYRTEDVSSEYPVEEFNWACAAERADSTGADIISSSLGYGYEFSGGLPDYPYSMLNGDITLSARAADLAAQKGLLVFNAAGNSGNDYWQKITTPADADSIIAVGAVSTAGNVGSFSSYGPSADGRIKPDVASVGVAAMIQGTNNSIAFSNGTSFACPNMAGLATCLWQGFPEVNNLRIIRALKESASKFTAPDNRIGYGIPDMKKAFTTLLLEQATVASASEGCNNRITWSSRDVNAMYYVVEGRTASETAFTPITTVTASGGTVLTKRDYNYTITNTAQLANTTLAVRVRQVIDTAAASYTEVVLDTIDVSFGANCNTGNTPTDIVVVAPNPAVEPAVVIVQHPEAVHKLSILVFDMKGSLIHRIITNKPAGRASFALPVQRFATGDYLVQVYDGEKLLGKTRFVKL